ncbi:MAG TPA: phenylalanine--tRNA ligase beta subunit-related protein [Gemmataceae bacterium]|nr:phenylalanine--tRNA ligase beta subunit-related protein [Gemmataceae bacterium]
MTSFIVSDDCIRLGLRAGAVVFRGVEVRAAAPELRADIAREVEAIRQRFANPADIRLLPEVVAFQEILRKVGVNPRREQPSVERLLNGAVKRGDLPSINSLVDAYNLVSVRSFCSLGAHDLDAITLPVALRLLTGRESFTPLGSQETVASLPASSATWTPKIALSAGSMCGRPSSAKSPSAPPTCS